MYDDLQYVNTSPKYYPSNELINDNTKHIFVSHGMVSLLFWSRHQAWRGKHCSPATFSVQKHSLIFSYVVLRYPLMTLWSYSIFLYVLSFYKACLLGKCSFVGHGYLHWKLKWWYSFMLLCIYILLLQQVDLHYIYFTCLLCSLSTDWENFGFNTLLNAILRQYCKK